MVEKFKLSSSSQQSNQETHVQVSEHNEEKYDSIIVATDKESMNLSTPEDVQDTVEQKSLIV